MVVGTVYTNTVLSLFVDIDTHLQSSNYSKKYYYHKRDIIIENFSFLLLRALLFTKYVLSFDYLYFFLKLKPFFL